MQYNFAGLLIEQKKEFGDGGCMAEDFLPIQDFLFIFQNTF
jgi:hypothetical protein